MDFEDTPQEAAFRAEARAFLQSVAPAKGGPDDFSAAIDSAASKSRSGTRRRCACQRVHRPTTDA